MNTNRGHDAQERRAALLPDAGAMVDEHGRAPGAASRTGTGAGPAADAARLDAERAAEAEVNVLVSHCDRAGADAVLGVLAEAFPGMAPPVPERAGASAAAPSIWSATVDVRHRAPGASPRAGPAGPATAELDGAAEPVRAVRAVLEDAFAGEHLGTVSGEHELQVALRLTARAS
ncbi:hypothetical protein [Streptomyces lavendulae]|uniref:hypothetical protein n=1 Tax=Streptomyces lavendulae TaxID=1914 RepID=UPI0024A1D461|nr:hypothetical protein [Streptomyces lavendulae]GLX16829.1 hypothetical protein Slala01_04730 [Streptomyces lavendulae subsp. lavendulae]